MPPHWSRREALRVAPVAIVSSLAGCGGSDGDGSGDGEMPTLSGTPGPDAGTDAYGIVAYNATETERDVTVVVELAWEDETPLEETVTLAANEAREWDHVLTEEKEYVIRAELPPDGNSNVEATPAESENRWLTPGSEDAPDVENVGLVAQTFETQDGGETTLVGVKTDPEEMSG